MYLLDTNILSELRRPKPHGAVLEWLRAVADVDLYLAAVTIGEIQTGIEITREQDAAKAAEIEDWLEQVARTYNVLPMDALAFRRWALLMHRRPHRLIEETAEQLGGIRRRVREGIGSIAAGNFLEYDGREGLKTLAENVKSRGRKLLARPAAK